MANGSSDGGPVPQHVTGTSVDSGGAMNGTLPNGAMLNGAQPNGAMPNGAEGGGDGHMPRFDPHALGASGMGGNGMADAAALADSRARSQHTQVFSENGDSIVRLHQTNIVTIKANGDVSLSSGGWRTHQTLKGINLSLKSFVPNLQVVADGHVAEGSWRVTNGLDFSAPFYDGVTVPGAGPQSLAAQAAQMPGLFEQMSINTASEGDGNGFGGGKGKGGGGRGGGRGGDGMGGGRGLNTSYGPNGFGKGKGSGKGADRQPLPSRPPTPLDEDVAKIDMDAYDDIPVEASGEDCPPPIESFADLTLHPTLTKNIEYAKFMKMYWL